MTKREWNSVTSQSPCRICGKPDWCSVSTDGHRDICRRVDNGSGIRKVDRSGAGYWVYKRGGRATENVEEKMSSDGRQEPDKADPDTLHTVYTVLLDDLTIGSPHRQHLNRRSLSERDKETRILHPSGG